MNKTFSFLCALLLGVALSNHAKAQSVSTNTLDASVSKKANDLRNQARRLFYSSKDSAINILHESLTMALSVEDSSLAVMIVADMGARMYDLGQRDSALYYYDYGLNISDNYKGRSYIYLLHNYGDFFTNTDQFDRALDFYKKAELASFTAEDSTFLPDIYARLGNLWYGFTNDYEQAIRYFDLSIETAGKYKNSMFQYIYLYNAASAALEMFPDSLGFTYMEKLLAMHRERYPDLGNDANHFELAHFIGLNDGDYEGNIRRLKEYIRKTDRTNHHQATINGLERLANYFNNPDSSIYYLKKMQIKSREDNDDLYELLGYRLISKKFVEKNDYKSALEYYKKYDAYSDSINGIKQQNALADIREKYESDRKELTIASLENKNLMEKAVSQQRTTQRNWLIAGFLLLLILTGFVISFFRQRLKNTELEASIAEARITELEQQQQILTMNSMIEGQENERRRIAQDLHDGLGGLLTTIKMHFSNIQNEITQLENLNMVEKTGDLIETANTEVRKLAHHMMPGSLVKLGLNEALSELCDRSSISNSLDIHFEVLNMDKRLTETAEIMLFRMAQEMINNIQKHAEANEVILQLSGSGDYIELIAEDNGRGFNQKQALESGSLGLKSISSRAKFLNGDVKIESTIGTGTTITISIPKEENCLG